MLRESTSVGSVIYAEGAAGAEPELVVCERCTRSFKGQRGLSLHQRRAHPLEYHGTHQVGPRVKARWISEESRRMAEHEASLRLSGVKPAGINKLLFEKFQKRSYEGMKGERRKDAYRKYVSDLVLVGQTPVGEVPTPDCPVGEATAAGDRNLWKVEMLACIEDLIEKRGNPEEGPLWDALQGACAGLSGGSEDLRVKTCIDLHAERLVNLLAPKRVRKRRPKKAPRKRGHRFAKPGPAKPGDESGVSSATTDGARAPPKRPRKPNPNRIARTQAYGRVQAAFRKNRKRCADMVLEGKWGEEATTLGLEEQEAFWRPLLAEPSTTDDRPVRSVPEDWQIVDPVSVEEVRKALHDSEESAPGTDGITLKDLKSVSPSMLAAAFNMWLLAGHAPDRFTTGETILIPKDGDLKNPANYRPITTTSRVTRVFHKVLASRLTRSVPLDPRQKAFRPVDGCADNVYLLDTLIKDAKRRRRPLALCFLDVAKAFDSVSNATVLRELRRHGFPEPLVEYVRCSLTNSTTCLKVGGRTGAPILCGRGVRQGDPLSAILFNCVIDEVIAGLSNSIGFSLSEDLMVRCLAFADDLVLVASTADGLRDQVARVIESLLAGGMRINPAKCSSLRLDVDGGAKRWVVNASPFLFHEGEQIKTLNIEQSYKYLGLQAGPKGLRKAYGSFLQEKLDFLSRAPLKPQQRMYILRCYLLPKTYHGLVLGETSSAALEQYDRSVRQSIRRWLRLPLDTVTEYFHASAVDGGLEIPRLRYVIPVFRGRRMAKLESSLDPVLQYVANSPCFIGAQVRNRKMTRVVGQTLETGRDVRRLLGNQLHRSVDGRGLRHQRETPHVNDWVRDGSDLLTGGDYLEAVLVRGNLLATAERCSRGRRTVPPKCDAMCNASGTLAHISQSCMRTHLLRCARHDSVLDYIVSKRRASAGPAWPWAAA
jgi:hypothetical protein